MSCSYTNLYKGTKRDKGMSFKKCSHVCLDAESDIQKLFSLKVVRNIKSHAS